MICRNRESPNLQVCGWLGKPQLNMMLLTFRPGRTLLWLVVMAEAHFAEADAFARLKILEGSVQVCSGPIFVLPYAGDADPYVAPRILADDED